MSETTTLQLKSTGETVLMATSQIGPPIPADEEEGGGGGGVTDHGALTGLGDPDHPIAAVQGLQAALDAKATAANLAAEAAARAAADLLLIPLTQKAAAGGVATLDGGGKILPGQLPSVAISDWLGEAASQAAMLALVGQRGDWVTRTDESRAWIIIGDDPTQLASWKRIETPADLVSSVNGRTGAVVGLAEQADLAAEIANRVADVDAEQARADAAEVALAAAFEALDDARQAVEAALDGRLDVIEANGWVTTARIGDGQVTAAKVAADVATQAGLDAKAPLASPTFTGNVVVPDADAATEAMNRQTSDARYQPIGAYVEDAIVNGETAKAPSQNAVFDALALKAPPVDRIFIPARSMGAGPNAPTANHDVFVALVWLMPDAAISNVGVTIELPAHWATYKVSMRWTNLGAASGNVRIRPDTDNTGDGETIVRTQQPAVTAAAPAQDVVATTLLVTDLAVSPGGLHSVLINRLGTDGADSFTGNMGLLGLVFEKVSPS